MFVCIYVCAAYWMNAGMKTGKRSHLSLWLQTQLLFFLCTSRHKEFTVDFLVFACPKQKPSEGLLLVVGSLLLVCCAGVSHAHVAGLKPPIYLKASLLL